MRRRTLLGSAAGVVVGTAGCLGGSQPDLSIRTGAGTLHPASQQYITDGLEPGGDRSAYAAVAPDEAPDLVGADASTPIARRLRRGGADQFHIVTQLRSTPAAPLRFGTSQAVSWEEGRTVRLTTTVETATDLDATLNSASQLVYTAVWGIEPELEELPDEAELQLENLSDG